MDAKVALDLLFKDVKFDNELINKLIRVNINFTTSNRDTISLFGDVLLGCYHLTYTQYHKNNFYEDLFGMTYDEVMKTIDKITSIRRDFKIARDDINLVCFYMAHRFINNKDIKLEDRETGVIESFNYFGYRTLLMMNNKYWIYPITEDKARTVYESLIRSFLIKKMKNWNEYVLYRSEQYLKGNLMPIIVAFTDTKRLPNAINDLYGRYNDMVKKYIQSGMESLNGEHIKSNKNVISDRDGKEVLLDRLSEPSKYVDKVINKFIDVNAWIRRDLVEVTATIVTSVSQDQLQEALELTYKYYLKNVKNTKEVNAFIEDFITDCIAYLQYKRLELNNDPSVLEVINLLVGNLLYSRGSGISITAVKERGEKLLGGVYRVEKLNISKRNLTNMRNAFCVYILLQAFI